MSSDSTELPLYDSRNYRRARATLPGYRKGQSPVNRGKKYPPEVLSRDEVLLLLDACPSDKFGLRLRALIAVLYRTGMSVSEALGARIDRLDLRPGREAIRAAGTQLVDRQLALDAFALSYLKPWLKVRQDVPRHAVFCVLEGPTAGREWNEMQFRSQLRPISGDALGRSVKPGWLRFTCAAELIVEQWPLSHIQSQLGMKGGWGLQQMLRKLGVESADAAEVAELARARPEP